MKSAPDPERVLTMAILQHLTTKGVVDPNVDLWLGLLNGNTAGVKAALDSGADPNIRIGQVVSVHVAELNDFDPPRPASLGVGAVPSGGLISAHCWSCVVGLTKVSPSTGDPVGVCRDCGVLGCIGHGTIDRLSGLWVCHKSVAKQAGAAAGIPTQGSQVSPLQIKDRSDLRARFRDLVAAADSMQSVVADRFVPGRSQPQGADSESLDVELLRDALAIGLYLTSEVSMALGRDVAGTTVVFGPLDGLLDSIRRG